MGESVLVVPCAEAVELDGWARCADLADPLTDSRRSRARWSGVSAGGRGSSPYTPPASESVEVMICCVAAESCGGRTSGVNSDQS